MAITTLDGAIAGFQFPRMVAKNNTGTLVAGRPTSYWSAAGSPSAGSYNGTLNGVTLDSTSAQVAGQIPFTNPVSGNAYLAQFTAGTLQGGTVVLADRIWHNGGYTITSTAAQNSTTPTWPSRSIGGGTGGDGILLGLEISATTGAGTPTITVTYTNQDGTASRTGTNYVSTVASSIAGSFYPIGLQSGDTGVRSVQSLQLSATWTSGTMNLVAYRPVAFLAVSGASAWSIDTVSGGLPQFYNGSVPFVYFIPSTTTATPVSGVVQFTHG